MARRTSSKTATPLNVVGPRVRELRLERDYSQADLARQLQIAGWDVDPASLNRIEKQQRTVTDIELLLISKVLSVRLGAFDNLLS